MPNGKVQNKMSKKKKYNVWRELEKASAERLEFNEKRDAFPNKLKELLIAGEVVYAKWHNPDSFGFWPFYLAMKLVKTKEDTYTSFTYNTFLTCWQEWTVETIDGIGSGSRLYEIIPTEQEAIQVQLEFDRENGEIFGISQEEWITTFWGEYE